MTRSAPIVVVGGGPAGAACALELAAAGQPVRLYTVGGGVGPPLGETAGPSLVRLLWSVGLMFPRGCGTELEGFGVSWEDDRLTDTSARPWDVTGPRALDRPAFDQWLRGEAVRAGATVCESARVTRGEPDGPGWRVFVQDHDDPGERCLAARFVVEATGRGARSVCHSRACRYYTDNLVGVSVDLSPHPASASEAMVEAAEDGWWYSLRTAGARPFICYFTDADEVPRQADRLRWWTARLGRIRHLRERVATVRADATVRTWDARTSIRSVLWRGSWLAVGDAAWAMDPLSGAGVERAVRSGIAAGRAIAAAVEGKTEDPLRDFAISQVNSFREADAARHRVYTGVTRFHSRFWSRRADEISTLGDLAPAR